jgi:hypothetical protein
MNAGQTADRLHLTSALQLLSWPFEFSTFVSSPEGEGAGPVGGCGRIPAQGLFSAPG